MSYVVNVTTGVTSWLLSVPNLDNVELEPRSFFFLKSHQWGNKFHRAEKKTKKQRVSCCATTSPRCRICINHYLVSPSLGRLSSKLNMPITSQVCHTQAGLLFTRSFLCQIVKSSLHFRCPLVRDVCRMWVTLRAMESTRTWVSFECQLTT